MAINKVVNSTSKSHGAMSNVISYVLRSDKVTEGFVLITGPYKPDTITKDGVYRSFLDEKKQWGNDSGRMYSHNIISFHKNERITPAQCLEIGKEFSGKFFNDFQNLIGIHQDKDHLHCHIVTNTVSYIDGHKLHQTKHDLEKQKAYTNELCRGRGFTVAEKGKHFDGSQIEEGHITSWKKDKYNLLANDSKKSYAAECAISIMKAVPESATREEFILKMSEMGWAVKWSETRKHIIYQDKDGHKIRDSNIEKTFSLNASKEALNREFERQAEQRRESQELDQYYATVESAISRASAVIKGSGTVSDSHIINRCPGGGKAEELPTDAFDFGSFFTEFDSDLKNAGAAVDDNWAQNRDVQNPSHESPSSEEESRTPSGEPRLAARIQRKKSERSRESHERDFPYVFADR